MATKRQLDQHFVNAVANSINHIKDFQGRYWYKNLEHPALFGEFVTCLRRELVGLAEYSPQLKAFCFGICRKEAWETVGKPKQEYYSYRCRGNVMWHCTTPADDGEWHMSFDLAEQLAKQANIQAKYQTPDEQDSVEITIQLSRLEQQLKDMKATISVAENLNNEADKVVVNLCKIAETLVA